jgi:hypothetical protein
MGILRVNVFILYNLEKGGPEFGMKTAEKAKL